MRWRLIVLFCLSVCAGSAFAAPVLEKKDGAVYVEKATTAEVENLFRQNNFEEYNVLYGKYPRIYLKKLPTDWKQVLEDKKNNHNKSLHRTFIRILLPLVLKVNENILAERVLIENISDKFNNNLALNEQDIKILEDKAAKYDVFTRMKGNERISILIKGLLNNIDTLPPSLMIASAAAYTNWGTSRLATKANSLYLEEAWYTDEGLKPLDDENAQYRYKIFESLEESIAAHALKINSSPNYEYLRAGRALSRKMKRPPYGEELAVQMMYDNNMKNIAGLIDYTLVHYKLSQTDYFPQLRDAQ